MRMFRAGLVIGLLSATAAADSLPAGVRAHATRRTADIAIDGRLDEAAWTSAPRNGGFVQRFPKDGAKASQDTQFAMLYDDKAIYVGVWMQDTEPHLIRPLLTRRD